MSASPTPPQSMRAWRVHAYGERPTEALRLDEVPVPSPGPGELLVRVAAIPLNLNDLERINGRNMMVRPELPYAPGMEVMGEVAGTGAGAEAWQGRRVVAMAKQAVGGFAEYAIGPAVSAFEMPGSVPLPGAAALYFPFHLAWLGLFDRARLREGETVLVHAAAGGAGSAAVQLAVDAGARVFATVGSDAKARLCTDLGAERVINYEREDFLPVVLDATESRGVDVVFDNVGHAVLEKSIRCIAYGGRYVMNGFASDKSHLDQKTIVPRHLATGNFSLCGVLLTYADAATAPAFKRAMGWNFAPRALGERIHGEILDRVARKKIAPVVGRVVDFEALPAAMEAMANRETVGRTIVRTTVRSAIRNA